ncbi:hypothetical protein FRAHR75_10048 [Frankia sp. Hr75.2]|nr:hypothetical protein FRAHR75_10048 [Frankia sp. Hr75.2]
MPAGRVATHGGRQRPAEPGAGRGPTPTASPGDGLGDLALRYPALRLRLLRCCEPPRATRHPHRRTRYRMLIRKRQVLR